MARALENTIEMHLLKVKVLRCPVTKASPKARQISSIIRKAVKQSSQCRCRCRLCNSHRSCWKWGEGCIGSLQTSWMMQISTSAGLLPRASSLRIFKNEAFPSRGPFLLGAHRGLQETVRSIQSVWGSSILPNLRCSCSTSATASNTASASSSKYPAARSLHCCWVWSLQPPESNDRSAHTHRHGGHRAHLLPLSASVC